MSDESVEALREENERLTAKVREQRRQITIKENALHDRNVALDAMHWVWCSGSCSGGVHRFNKELAPLTEEMVALAERNTLRLRRKFTTLEWIRQNAISGAPPRRHRRQQMTTEIKPALTAEEWAEVLAGNAPWLYRADNGTPEEYHAVGALYLYGQPFGFTRRDVEELRQAAETIRADYRVWKEGREEELAYVERLLNLADRIEALLPPISDTGDKT